MTKEEKLAMLRVMMDGDDTDNETLSVYLDLAKGKILNRMSPFAGNYSHEEEAEATDPETGEPLTDPDTGEAVMETVTVSTDYPTEVPEKYEMIQLKIACYLLNKRGAEGETQHIEGGIHRNYGDSDVPESMLKDVVAYVGLIR